MSVWTVPLASVEEPTAQQSFADAQVRPAKPALTALMGVGLATMLQPFPVFCSIRV